MKIFIISSSVVMAAAGVYGAYDGQIKSHQHDQADSTKLIASVDSSKVSLTNTISSVNDSNPANLVKGLVVQIPEHDPILNASFFSRSRMDITYIDLTKLVRQVTPVIINDSPSTTVQKDSEAIPEMATAEVKDSLLSQPIRLVSSHFSRMALPERQVAKQKTPSISNRQIALKKPLKDSSSPKPLLSPAILPDSLSKRKFLAIKK